MRRTDASAVRRLRKEKGADDRDPQASRVYAWEREWKDWNVESLTLPQCRTVVRIACKHFGLKPPRVRQHRSSYWSWCDPTIEVIDFQAVKRRGRAGQKNKAVALHEAAHFIYFKFHGWRGQDHGPTFLAIYLWLLEKARVAPPVALRATARSHGLRWCPLAKVVPRGVGSRPST